MSVDRRLRKLEEEAHTRQEWEDRESREARDRELDAFSVEQLESMLAVMALQIDINTVRSEVRDFLLRRCDLPEAVRQRGGLT